MGLAGEVLSTCGDELVTCEDDLTTCATDLGTAEADLTDCGTDLGTAQADLSTCDGDLAVALDCGNGLIDAGEVCDQGNLNGGTCVGEGFAGGVLHCGAGCVYDTSKCYAARFVDNADGTITDNDSGLMWEKKVKLGVVTDLANRQDADNIYRWSGTCSIGGAYCQADAASEAACLAGVEGNNNGCGQCVSGVCNVAVPGVTVWQWLVALNGASFGGHDDWRLAKLQELQSIIDYSDNNTPPAVNVAFHGASCGVACTDVNDAACSCTQSGFYWSASTYGQSPDYARIVNFHDGSVLVDGKAGYDYVRAVRGGS